MACYKCGGSDGDEGKLCPKCTKERLQGYKEKAQQEAPRGKEVLDMESPWDRLEFMLQLPIVKLLLGVSVALVASYYIMFSRLGPGLGYPKADRLYFECMEKVAKKTAFDPARLKPSIGAVAKEMETAMAGLADSMAKGMGEQICKLAKEACAKDKAFCNISF